jgi:predicted phosphodiesterase
MSLLVIGDLHIKPSNFRNIEIMKRDILQIMGERKVTITILLGDILDNFEKIDLDSLNIAEDLFDSILSTGSSLIVLIGNHDRKNNKDFLTNKHVFNSQKHKKGITIVDTCIVYDVQLNIDKKIKFCLVPYVPNDMYFKALEHCSINPKEISLFFSHHEFSGCKINMLSKSKTDVWPLDYPLNISGHIHDMEIVQPNLFYTGTPFQQSFSDLNNKGVFIIDLNSKNFDMQRIELSVPRKIKLKVHYTQINKIILDSINEYKLEILGPHEITKEIMNRPDMIAKFGHISKKYKDEEEVHKQLPEISHSCMFYEKYILGIQSNPKLLQTYKFIEAHFK